MGNKVEEIKKQLENYKKNQENITGNDIPKFDKNNNPENFVNTPIPTQPNTNDNAFMRETDPDLMVGFEIVPLPSKGLFYKNELAGLKEIEIEYMTSSDEDFITTPSLIESGEVLLRLVNKKIRNKTIKAENLLPGDFNALLLFLRKSSYGNEYKVSVVDPRTGKNFPDIVDLDKLTYKKIEEKPDEEGLFSLILPMRKKLVKFRLLTYGEDQKIFKQAEELQKAYNTEYSEYRTLKLKAEVQSIDGNTDKSYISKFIDVMPAGDSFAIRRKILDVSPDVDMNYTFKTKDGYTFQSQLVLGLDFFFPDI